MKQFYFFFIWCSMSIVSCSAGNDEPANEASSEIFATGLNTFPGIGEEQELKVVSDKAWKIRSDSKWLAFTPSSGEGSVSVRVTAAYNLGNSRVAECLISNEDNSITLEVSQEKAVKPATNKKAGDPDVSFDQGKMDERYSQMREWIKAGVEGGIPFLRDEMRNIKYTFESDVTAEQLATVTKSLSDAGGGTVYLKNGTYHFASVIRMYDKISVVGESREGVKIIIDESMKTGKLFDFYNSRNSGLRNVTIQGGWRNGNGDNHPEYPWNEDSPVELPDVSVISIGMGGAVNCWVDNVSIINSALHPIYISDKGEHNTIRDTEIDGCFNKGGGCQGYLYIGGASNLVTGCRVTHLRHISMQGESSKYNVVFDNDFRQEVSFHSGDGGDNLVEYNRILLPEDMPDNYYAIMGPWSIQHKIGGVNYLYRNSCQEDNHRGVVPWFDPKVVYCGPWEVKPANPHANFTPSKSPAPKGGTFYPAMLD